MCSIQYLEFLIQHTVDKTEQMSKSKLRLWVRCSHKIEPKALLQQIIHRGWRHCLRHILSHRCQKLSPIGHGNDPLHASLYFIINVPTSAVGLLPVIHHFLDPNAQIRAGCDVGRDPVLKAFMLEIQNIIDELLSVGSMWKLNQLTKKENTQILPPSLLNEKGGPTGHCLPCLRQLMLRFDHENPPPWKCWERGTTLASF